MNNFIKLILVLVVSMGIASSHVFAGELVIKGSATVLPIAQKTAEAYMAQHPDVKISLYCGRKKKRNKHQKGYDRKET